MEEVCCEFKYSRVACGFLAAAVGGTLALVVIVPFPDAIRAALFAYVVGAATVSHGRLRGVRELRLDCRRGVSVRIDERWLHGEIRDGGFVAPWLVVLRWRPEGARFDRTLVVLPDMIPANAMRKIRVIVRWG